MKTYIYILEPYKGMKSRYDCPNCGKRKVFVRYIDTTTNLHIAHFVGKCNRLNNCGYHFTPKQYFEENRPLFEPKTFRKEIIKTQNVISIIPGNYVINSLTKFDQNNFVQFLLQQFGNEITGQLIKKYFIGTSKLWQGATVFWQIDCNKTIRAGKIMLYNAITGNRIKEPYNHVTWVHSVLKLPEFNLQQCLFGEHLLNIDLAKPIAIVESEKTAIIASVYLPEFIWLACGSATGLTFERCKVLQGRKVVLYPDLNFFDLWSKKSKELSQVAHFSVSDLLEQNASEDEKKQSLDIADYLLRFDYKKNSQNGISKISFKIS